MKWIFIVCMLLVLILSGCSNSNVVEENDITQNGVLEQSANSSDGESQAYANLTTPQDTINRLDTLLS